MSRTFRKKFRWKKNDEGDHVFAFDPEAPDHSCRPGCMVCGKDVKHGNHKDRLPARDKRKILED